MAIPENLNPLSSLEGVSSQIARLGAKRKLKRNVSEEALGAWSQAKALSQYVEGCRAKWRASSQDVEGPAPGLSGSAAAVESMRSVASG